MEVTEAVCGLHLTVPPPSGVVFAGGEWPFLCHCNSPHCKHPLLNHHRSTAAAVTTSGEENKSHVAKRKQRKTSAKKVVRAKEKIGPTGGAMPEPTSPRPAAFSLPVPFDSHAHETDATTAFLTAYIAAHGITSQYRWTDERQLQLFDATTSHQPPITLLQTDVIHAMREMCRQKEREEREKKKQ